MLGTCQEIESLMDSKPSFCQARRDLLQCTCTLAGTAAVAALASNSGKCTGGVTGKGAEGVLAYSVVYPQLGCILTDWVEDKTVLLDPCQESTFDPLQGGKNTSG